jgi:alpha-D-ribose 1-methylphosphonate 5-triphosphate synthase subunit PhnH
MSNNGRTNGFENAVHESQSTYRVIMRAMSQPGVPVRLDPTCNPPGALARTTAAVSLTLLDSKTIVWIAPELSAPDVSDYLTLRTGTGIAARNDSADFALVDGSAAMALDNFNLGTVYEPHKATTLVIQVQSLHEGDQVELCGPGIADTAILEVTGLSAGFWTQWDANAELYPCGVDVLLVDGVSVCGLPRTTRRSNVRSRTNA